MNRKSPSWFNLPNILTLLRMLCIPMFVTVYFSRPDARWIALMIFLFASLTDALDGWLARKWNQITSVGKLFDPLADKLMVLTMLCCLASENYLSSLSDRMNWVIVGVMVAKEACMLIGSLFMLTKRVVVKSNKYGKTATVGFIAGLTFAFPWHNVAALYAVGRILIFLSMLLSIVAMGIYTKECLQNLKEAPSD